MRRFSRWSITACAVMLAALPLFGSGSVTAGATTTTAQVAAANWSLMPNTQTIPTSTPEFATSVSCVTSTYCMAVGSGFLFGGSYFAELWNGSTWSPVTLPGTGGGAPALSEVSCVSTTFCVAVGTTDLGSSGGGTLIEQWNGTTWTIVPGTPTANTALLGGVACTSATFCLAVGLTATSATSDQLLSEQWNGTTWTRSSLPAPSTGTVAEPLSLACGSPTSCMAVGLSGPEMGGGAAQAWSAYWNGSTWTTPAVPSASGGTTYLADVSCAGTSSCMAVGFFSPTGTSSAQTNVVVTWNGTSWSPAPTPTTTGSASGNILDGVSCFERDVVHGRRGE